MKVMKTTRNKFTAERGTVLFVTLVATGILAAALASYLKLVSTQNYSVARSQAWNRAIPILEGGIEEAMAQINWNRTPASLISNGWVLSGTNYVKTNYINGEYCITKVALLAWPIIQSQGFAKIPLQSDGYVSRTVRVTTKTTSPFTKAMAADGVIDLNGNNVATDSFDSQSTTYSNNGLYDSSRRKANGDVATNGDIINVGNADVYGHVSTGPGGTTEVSKNGAVGDLAWHTAGNTGIQTGFANDDMNVEFAPVTPPFTIGLPPTTGFVGTTNYGYLLSGTGTQYSMSSLNMSGNGTGNQMMVTGDVTLYVSGDVSLSGQASIIVAQGARLRMYVNGSSTSFGGNGIVNGNGNATNFMYYGTPNNTSVSMTGNSAFVGTVYAPSADLHLGGGGNNTYDFVGASVSRTVDMNGRFNFHYDENLGRMNNDAFFVITSWNEMSAGL